jgi:nucleotide-binding universal stress UspA family protein
LRRGIEETRIVERIIVPLDGSAQSESAVPLSRLLAKEYSSPIQIVHVLDSPSDVEAPMRAARTEPADVRTYLTGVAQRSLDDIPTNVSVRSGGTADEILAVAQSERPLMIVMATHGRGGASRFVLGSVADQVVRRAAVPVALVRAAPTPCPVPEAIEHILIALDGSELAEQTLGLATALARQTGATLHLVRVVEPLWSSAYAAYGSGGMAVDATQIAELMVRMEQEARSYLSRIAGAIQAEGISVEWTAKVGHPVSEILLAASAVPADMILASSHGRSGLSRVVLGGVTASLMHRSLVPLLIVPAGAVLTEEGQGSTDDSAAQSADRDRRKVA